MTNRNYIITSIFLLVALFLFILYNLYYYQADNMMSVLLFLFPFLFYSAYFWGLIWEKELPVVILFLVSTLSLFLMIVPFIGVGFAAQSISSVVIICLLILYIAFVSGFFTGGEPQKLMTVLIGNTLGFGIIVWGALSSKNLETGMYIFLAAFYVMPFLGYFFSKLFIVSK